VKDEVRRCAGGEPAAALDLVLQLARPPAGVAGIDANAAGGALPFQHVPEQRGVVADVDILDHVHAPLGAFLRPEHEGETGNPHGTAEVDLLIDLLEGFVARRKARERYFERPVDDDAAGHHRAVLHDEHDRLAEVGVDDAGRGDEEERRLVLGGRDRKEEQESGREQ
jgi:hypothetical protein